MDELEKQLDEIEKARAKLQAKLSESLEALGDIEHSLSECKSRQVKRMRADRRVHESIVEQVEGDAE